MTTKRDIRVRCEPGLAGLTVIVEKCHNFARQTLAEGPVFDGPFDAHSNEFVRETRKNRNNSTRPIHFGHHRFRDLSEFQEKRI